jgi:hypothetical protein
VWLHPENETRLLSITITDSSEQTAAVFQALAKDDDTSNIDLSRWHALQTWLATGPSRVVIPFAKRLALLVPPLAIRLRRDFKTVLLLIRAHALLHQATRLKDGDGKVVATLEDYAAVRDLVADLVAEGVEATIKPEVRETVKAVEHLIAEGLVEVRQIDLKSVLRLDRSVISRRVATALDGGFLKNLEDRKGRPARLVIGDPLPANREVLPSPNRLEGEPLHDCAQDCGDKTGAPLRPIRRTRKGWSASRSPELRRRKAPHDLPSQAPPPARPRGSAKKCSRPPRVAPPHGVAHRRRAHPSCRPGRTAGHPCRRRPAPGPRRLRRQVRAAALPT